ncbi:hypothetical protein B0H13DRAFT_2535907 [Mycena leptocephala]|nr:hypothetical protein B0H13DRAFT_2535907 [Mycena leptocephala]
MEADERMVGSRLYLGLGFSVNNLHFPQFSLDFYPPQFNVYIQLPVFLITGCSSGFGRELTVAALKSGFRVIATARRVETLASLKQQGANVLTLDITSSETELAEFAATAIAIYGQVDYLISPAAVLRQFNTNFFGLVKTTNAFLPHFRERRTGTIVNISSQGSSLGTPGAVSTALPKPPWTLSRTYGPTSLPNKHPFDLSSVLKSGSVSLAEKFIEGYQFAHGVVDFMGKGAGSEPGDPAKAAANILVFVADPGRKQLPCGLLSGTMRFYTQQLADMEAAEQWSTGTNYPTA